MNLDDLRKSWQSELNRPLHAGQTPLLLANVQQRYHDMERRVHGRDIREIVVAVVMFGVFAMILPTVRSSAIATTGVVIVMVALIVILLVLLRAHKPTLLPFDASVLEFSRKRLAWLDGQIRLMRSVAWWYVSPIILGVTMLQLGMSDGKSVWGFSGVVCINLMVAAGIIWVNNYAVRTGLQPLRDQLAELIQILETTSEVEEQLDVST